ncbi:MAG: NADH-quinone oxidoreductase subunit N [Myxococcota bacterium]|jgi:NADH-quinone oxidoreductase subunit N|nr:NADH-quinone oxidoreductase subunit N [Myxococcota bacterium]
MSLAQLLPLAPLLLLAAAPVVTLLASAFSRSPRVVFAATLGLLAATLATLPLSLTALPMDVTSLLRLDGFGLFLLALLGLGGLVVACLADDTWQRRPTARADRFYPLLLFALAGMGVAVLAADFASFFLGLETLTVSLYGLLGFTRHRQAALEGGLKYLVLAAASTAFLLFGLALLYAAAGTLQLAELGPRLLAVGGGTGLDPQVGLGLGLILVAFGFKLALVPFHLIFPELYQSAPPPVAALLAAGSKGAIFAALARFLALSGLTAVPSVVTWLAFFAALTMTVGNLAALRQGSLRRLLAYSSVAHVGYLLLALLALPQGGLAALLGYLAIYGATVLVLFGGIGLLAADGQEADRIDELTGLAQTRPLLAGLLALALLSLTGVPLTAGFVAKLLLFTAAFDAGHHWLVGLAAANSVLSAFYYLRVVIVLYRPGPPARTTWPRASRLAVATLVLLGAFLLLGGLLPDPLVQLVRVASQGLGGAP